MSYSVDARRLVDWQSCRRKLLLSTDYRPLKWRAHTLFNACLRRAIVALGNGTQPEDAAKDARTDFMQAAASPGLDILGGNPYAISKEWCVMFETILRGLRVVPIVKDHAPVRLNGQFEWKVRAHADEAGNLHRWITVDSWSLDDVSRELHGWPVIGDIATTGMPMMLHVIEIGQERKGRRVSPWARAYMNPAMPSLRYRFKRTSVSEPVWLMDLPQEDPDEWVAGMDKEGLLDALVHHLDVQVPPAEVCADIIGQVLREGIDMRAAETDRTSIPWRAWPMSRSACDAWNVPCVWQACCYGERGVQPEDLGLYQIRTIGYSNRVAQEVA